MAGSAFQGVRRVWLRDGRHAAALLSVLSVVRKGEGGRHRGGHNAWAGNAASSPESANSISPLCAMLRRPSIELACGCWPGGYRAGELGAGVACRLSEAEFPMQDHVPPADVRYRQVSRVPSTASSTATRTYPGISATTRMAVGVCVTALVHAALVERCF